MPLTVFIHGTLPPYPLTALPFAHEFFYCPPGLTKASDLDASYILAQSMSTLSEKDPLNFPLTNIYLFGWSGLLSKHERKQASLTLFETLTTLTHQYPEEPLTLITHSHGGNVVLHMAHEHALRAQSKLKIHQLILLACPVQITTQHYLNSPLFTTIISLFSTNDIIQILDPQGLYHLSNLIFTLAPHKALRQALSYPLFSERIFPPQDNLTQIHITLNKRAPLHLEFVLPSCICFLPDIIDHATHKHMAPCRFIKNSFELNLT